MMNVYKQLNLCYCRVVYLHYPQQCSQQCSNPKSIILFKVRFIWLPVDITSGRESEGERGRKSANVNKSDENKPLTFKMRPCPWTESVRWISTLKGCVSIFGEAALLLWRTSVSRCLLLDTPANNIFYFSICVKKKKNEHDLKPSLTQSGQKKEEQNVMD